MRTIEIRGNFKQPVSFNDRNGGVLWKSARISEFKDLFHSVCGAIAAIEVKKNEIASLRRVVCESARLVARRQPYIEDSPDLIESIFAATSPYHLGTARSAAIRMQRILGHAIASLSELPGSEVAGRTPPDALVDTTEKAFLRSREAVSALLQAGANGEKEVQTLQCAFLAFSAGKAQLRPDH